MTHVHRCALACKSAVMLFCVISIASRIHIWSMPLLSADPSDDYVYDIIKERVNDVQRTD